MGYYIINLCSLSSSNMNSHKFATNGIGVSHKDKA